MPARGEALAFCDAVDRRRQQRRAMAERAALAKERAHRESVVVHAALPPAYLQRELEKKCEAVSGTPPYNMAPAHRESTRTITAVVLSATMDTESSDTGAFEVVDMTTVSVMQPEQADADSLSLHSAGPGQSDAASQRSGSVGQAAQAGLRSADNQSDSVSQFADDVSIHSGSVARAASLGAGAEPQEVPVCIEGAGPDSFPGDEYIALPPLPPATCHVILRNVTATLNDTQGTQIAAFMEPDEDSPPGMLLSIEVASAANYYYSIL
jgi:hypothetical protein